MSDKYVSMKTISKRDMTRQPSKITRIRPGESLHIKDREGGLVVTRTKPKRMTFAEFEASVEDLGKGMPRLDTLALHQEGE
jgi:hypothetical protein